MISGLTADVCAVGSGVGDGAAAAAAVVVVMGNRRRWDLQVT